MPTRRPILPTRAALASGARPRVGPAAPRRRGCMARCRPGVRRPPTAACCWACQVGALGAGGPAAGLIDADDPTLAPEQLLDPTNARAIGPWTDVTAWRRSPTAIAGRLAAAGALTAAALARPLVGAIRRRTLETGVGGHRPRPVARPGPHGPWSMDDFSRPWGCGSVVALTRRRPPTPIAPSCGRSCGPPSRHPLPRRACGNWPRRHPESWRSLGAGWRWWRCCSACLPRWRSGRPAPGLPWRQTARAELQRPNEMPVSEAVRSQGVIVGALRLRPATSATASPRYDRPRAPRRGELAPPPAARRHNRTAWPARGRRAWAGRRAARVEDGGAHLAAEHRPSCARSTLPTPPRRTGSGESSMRSFTT